MPDNNKASSSGSTVFSQENLICAGVLIGAVILASFLYPGLGSLSIWSALIALSVGAVAWAILHLVKSDYRITSTEATIASVVLMVLVVPIVDHVGAKMAFDNKVSYQEFWGGYESSVSKQVFNCHESDEQGGSTGGCVHTFDADSYTVQVPYTVEVEDRAAYTDSQGHYHSAVTHTETRYRTETRWRQVPFTTTETTWTIHTTLGDYTVGGNWFPDNPERHRIRAEDGSMDALPGVPTGMPILWAQARDRINAGDPGPVTQEHSYDNYILASEDAALKRYSPYIDQYAKQGVLPNLNHSVKNFYYMDRAYFVGNVGVDSSAWTASVERYNAALGASLQGDLYLVIADTHKVTDPDNYISTLTAYWQSPQFEKYAISKNAIVVVLGTEDGKTVKWARALTGMPVGNSTMVYAIQNQLGGKELTPASILGQPKGLLAPNGNGGYKVTIAHTPTPGALESIMWTGDTAFKRVSMTGKGSGSGVGFQYLKTQIQPTGGQLFGIYAVIFFFSLLIWGAMVFLAVPSLRDVLGHEPFGSGNNPQNVITRMRNQRRF